ncbi:MAG TPA: MFS transporter [Rhizomicrobium sp.]
MTDSPPAIYRDRDFRLFIASRILSTVAMQVLSVAIGWQIYDIERTPLALGLVGLCEFVPMFLLTLPAGEIADRFDQRRVLAIAQALLGVCAGLFLLFSLLYPRNALPFYGVLVLFGAARGFSGPSGQSLLAFLVPPERLAKSIALSSSAFTVAVIAGPALGGFLFAFGPVATYSVGFAGFILAAALTTTFAGRSFDRSTVAGVSRWERVVEGIRFVRERPIILGAISLDLFAVLLGGAVALLPVFARDILHVGPIGLGILRSSPAVGAALTAFTLSRWPIQRKSGARMFAAVAMFGVATIVFGLSRNLYLSLAALFVTGASDMVSVYIRQSLINFATPDPMRGRVGAVSMLFIGASNELGEFESGTTAALFGTVPAVIVGGLGTLGVVALWMWAFPRLRTVDRLTDAEPTSGKPA